MQTTYQQPDARGHFGIYGGSFVSETLTHAINELKAAYARYQNDPEFLAEFRRELAHFVGRPSPIYHAARMSREQGGAQIFLKREDLNHTGAHKINNTIGQAMLARRMGKPRIIAETGAGQHGVATATICARYGLECVVYMGSEDVKRQSPNVYRMKLLGATVVPVESGSKTLKDALNEAMRDWVTNVHDTFYIIGTVAGPHPYPELVRDFQSVIGDEARTQILEAEGRLPDMLIAAVGALVIGAVEEAATVLVLFLVGELLEGVAAGRARAGIRGLTALVPDTALIEQDGSPRLLATHYIPMPADLRAELLALCAPLQAQTRPELDAAGNGLLVLYRAICELDGQPLLHATPAAITSAGMAGEPVAAVVCCWCCLGIGGIIAARCSARPAWYTSEDGATAAVSKYHA